MELILAIQDGLGDGVFAQPAVVIETRQDFDDKHIDLSSIVVLRDNGEHTFNGKFTYTWADQVRFTVAYMDTPGETPNFDRSHTLLTGVELDMMLATLTADFSPNAYGAGRRSRFGIKSMRQITPRISVSGHSRIRYLSDKDDWKPQNEMSVRYQLNERADVSLNFIQHDFFDDATTIKYQLKAF